MTKKDYELIAQGFKEARKQLDGEIEHLEVFGDNNRLLEATKHELGGVNLSAYMVAKRLARQDFRFKTTQFLKDCGLNVV